MAKKAAPKKTSPGHKDGAKATTQKKARTEDKTPPVTPIVGIGASAGGLHALEELLTATPPNLGMAFVVIMHLDADHKSILAELLQRRTKMPVQVLTRKIRPKAGHVYVAPPGKWVSMEKGALRTTLFEESTSYRLPIDAFFRSLAMDQGSNAIGVVLSGTGSDGTLGVRALKAEHGMVIAQDESARYSGMPQSVVETGLADFVLPPGEIPACLLRYAEYSPSLQSIPTIRLSANQAEALQQTLSILRARTGHDFSQYKTNTILRRIQRRMGLHQLDSLADYQQYLKDNTKENGQLFRDLLIGVTGFFRDPEAFDALKAAAEQRLFAREQSHRPIRVWVAGCSTGEEAYSVAMVLHECNEASEHHTPLQVFATDIDEYAIETARAGIYPAGICSDISAERLKRFFNIEEDGRFKVKKRIRETLVFATQNVISDPPFSRLDLISCRNLLIYFSSELQRQILGLFHYSLNPEGLMLLGSSESIGSADKSFKSLDRKWKLFSRLPHVLKRSAAPLSAQYNTASNYHIAEPDQGGLKCKPETHLTQLLQSVLRETDTPPCAVVDSRLNIVFVHGRTGRFLEPAEGIASINILEMARPGLKEELGTCLRKAIRDRVEVRRQNISVNGNGQNVRVDLIAKPLLKPKALSGLTLVVLKESPGFASSETKTACDETLPPHPGSLEDLTQRLERTQENHQTTIEELETANEELQSAVEELQSTNEELQSANEELGTSKEELQSLNEEAATVNAELQSRIDELGRANDDLKNLLDSTEIATIFLDTDLNVRRFTPACSNLIPLEASDLGRPITHFATELDDVDLGKVASSMLDDLVVRELEVQSRAGQTYLLRVRPYRTSQNVIDGAVLTFEDRTIAIHARRLMEKKMNESATELGQTKRKLEESRSTHKTQSPKRRKG